MESSRRRRFRGVVLVSVVVTVLLGVAHLQFPFMGDQALFSVYGRMLDDGAVLYNDVWDVKQPGIFIFYGLAGRLFGFTELGAHTLELVYLGGFACVLIALLNKRYQTYWLSGLIPIVVAGWYYAVAQLDYLTQVEGLVGPLLFGVVWMLSKPGRGRALVAGLLSGAALYFKLAFVPLVAVLWLVTLHQTGGIRRRAGEAFPAGFAGVVLAVIPFAAYIVGNDLTSRVWWTFFTYPPQIVGIAERDIELLIRAIGQFGLLFLPIALLALRGLWARRTDPLTRIWFAWLIAGIATYMLQLWWGYLLLIIALPMALLALDGLDDLLTNWNSESRIEVAVLLIASIPALLTMGSKLIDLGQNGLGIGDSVEEYQASVSEDYGTIRDDLVGLTGTGTTPMYILGDPLYLFLSGRPQAPAVTGWSPGFWTDSLWEELKTGLVTERPELLLVDEFSARAIQSRSPDTQSTIESEYVVLRQSRRQGTWYIHSEAPWPQD